MPPYHAANVLNICIGGVQEPALVARLSPIIVELLNTAGEYHQLGQTQSLHQIARVDGVGSVTSEELQMLYSNQMSATRGAARAIYDAIRNASTNGKCPLCGVGNVTVLDHHLPKSRYPNLSVCPYNLIPSCDFCNNSKRARYPTSVETQTIHPYYDDFTQEQWIFGHLDIVGFPVVVFHVDAPGHWPQAARLRAKRHFEVVKLGQAYTSNANDDLISLRGHLNTIATKKGAEGVRAYLLEEKIRYVHHLNSWQHVMYQSLSLNDWFINGGYNAIPR